MKRASLLTKVFAGFALFVVIPLVVMLTYTNTAVMQSFEQEIAKAALGKLKIAGNVGAMVFEALETTGMQVAVDPRLTPLSEETRFNDILSDPAKTYNVMEFQNALSDLVRTNSLYQSIEVIPLSSDFEIGSEHGSTRKIGTGALDLSKVHALTREDPSDSRVLFLSYVYPLTSYISRMSGTVVVNIPEVAFAGKINAGNNAGEGTVTVLDSNGLVISDPEKSNVGTSVADSTYFKKIAGNRDLEGSFAVDDGAKRQIVSFLKVPERELVYVGRFSLDIMSQSLSALRANTILASMILIAIGLAASWILSKRLSNPVRKLAQDIRERNLLGESAGETEMHLISRAFESLERRETQLFSASERNRNRAEQAWILGLLEGQAQEKQGDSLGAVFPLPYSACAMLCIDHFRVFGESHSTERQYYLKSLVLGMAEEVFYPETITRGVIVDGSRIALVLNTSRAGEAWEKSVEIGFDALKTQAKKILDTSISMSLSTCGPGLAELAYRYQEAQSLSKLRFVRGHGTFIKHGTGEKGAYFYPKAMEQQIIGALEIADAEGVDSSVNELIDNLSSSRNLSYDNVMLILNQLAGSVVHFLIDRNVRIADVFGADFNVYAGLSENETLADTKVWFSDLLKRVVHHFAGDALEPQAHKSRIMDYVLSNYMKGFDINMIADSVGLSYSHVRKVFHDSYGENILQYVNNLRISEAKRMLRETAMNVNDIALRLGYNNTQSFTRYFKKIVRLTPGAYRSFESENDKIGVSKTEFSKQ